MTIKQSHRRIADAQRRAAVQTGNGFTRTLAARRRKEIERVIGIAKDYEPRNWETVFNTELSEPYLPAWYESLYVKAGIIGVKPTLKILSSQKADTTDGIFEASLRQYAKERTGQRIVTVTGTLREALIGAIRAALDGDINIGIETLAKAIREFASGELLWQARRISQTETLAALAEGQKQAADSLEIEYIKQWCCSGLNNTRETHLAMDGVTAEKGEYFILPDCKMLYPHDMENGTAAEVINCACSCIRIPRR